MMISLSIFQRLISTTPIELHLAVSRETAPSYSPRTCQTNWIKIIIMNFILVMDCFILLACLLL